jgi:hypothetical protein
MHVELRFDATVPTRDLALVRSGGVPKRRSGFVDGHARAARAIGARPSRRGDLAHDARRP